MSEQTAIRPGQPEHQGEHKGYQIWRMPDGIYEAFKTTASSVVAVAQLRSGEEKEIRAGTRMERMVLLAKSLPDAWNEIDERTKKPRTAPPPFNKDQVKMSFDGEEG